MVPIPEVIGRNPRTVERILGKAYKIEVISNSKQVAWKKAYYLQGQVEVVFVDNVADWINIYNIEMRSTIAFITHFGLTELTLSSSYNGIVTHKDVAGLKVITCVSSEGIPKMVQIKTFTE